MAHLLEQAETVRKEVGQQISQKRKSELGQFMTPSTVARFMASLFSPSTLKIARLLDAGAGIGSLSGAALDRFAAGGFPFQHVQVAAYEIDPKLRELLAQTLAKYQGRFDIDISVRRGDFIEEAVKLISQGEERFTHAILNPPY
jgi:predicted RNA methylase